MDKATSVYKDNVTCSYLINNPTYREIILEIPNNPSSVPYWEDMHRTSSIPSTIVYREDIHH